MTSNVSTGGTGSPESHLPPVTGPAGEGSTTIGSASAVGETSSRWAIFSQVFQKIGDFCKQLSWGDGNVENSSLDGASNQSGVVNDSLAGRMTQLVGKFFRRMPSGDGWGGASDNVSVTQVTEPIIPSDRDLSASPPASASAEEEVHEAEDEDEIAEIVLQQLPDNAIPELSLAQGIQGIMDRAGKINVDTRESTQSLLNGLVVELRKQHQGADVKISWELVADSKGRERPEAYSPPNKPDSTYYKTQVRYTIGLTKDGAQVKLPPITRNIFTTSPDPNLAMLTARKYAETVSQLALMDGGGNDKIRPENGTDMKSIMSQASFQFVFERDASSGKPNGLKQIKLGKKGAFKLTEQNQQKYAYNSREGKLLAIAEGGQTSKGCKFFESEYEAVMAASYLPKDGEPFKCWMEEAQRQGLGIKEAIKAKEQEIKELSDQLKSEQMKLMDQSLLDKLGWSKGDKKIRTEVRQYLQERRYFEAGEKPHNVDQLSEAFQAHLKAQEGLADLLKVDESAKNADKEIERLEEAINGATGANGTDPSQLQTRLAEVKAAQQQAVQCKGAVERRHGAWQGIFDQIESLNRQLSDRVDLLEEMAEQAKRLTADKSSGEWAGAFVKKFSEARIAKLQEGIKKNYERLDNMLGGTPPSTSLGETGGIEASADAPPAGGVPHEIHASDMPGGALEGNSS